MTGLPEPGAGPYVGLLEEALRETLERSLADRLAERPGAELNLDNAFWGAPPPRDLGEALTRLGPTCVNIAVRLFERLRDIDPALELWAEIRYLRNVWCGGSAGFKVVYAEPERMRARLDARFDGASGRRLARDTIVGGLEHQRGEMLDVLRDHLPLVLQGGEPPHADSWREVHRPGEEAIHLCVGKLEPRPTELDDIHLDWKSPVVGVNPSTRRCRYGLFISATHWVQARFGIGKPVFPFHEIDGSIAALSARGASPAGWEAFAARWRAARWALAMRGRAGAEEAMAWLGERDRVIGGRA